MLVGLVARLFAHVEIDGDAEARLPGFASSATELLERLSWLRPSPTADPTVDRVIGLGDGGHRPVDPGIGGDTWTARISRHAQPVGAENPVTASDQRFRNQPPPQPQPEPRPA